MGIFAREPPWYVAGLAFECAGCGRCCAGPEEGYIWATDAEIAAVAGFLGIPEARMKGRFTRKVGRRVTLVESRRNNDCIFLLPCSEGGRKCGIHPVRPAQCRSWPFWPSNLESPESWATASLRCPGINRGRLWPFDEIETKRNSARA